MVQTGMMRVRSAGGGLSTTLGRTTGVPRMTSSVDPESDARAAAARRQLKPA
jgi:hypothetical protein